MHSEKFIRDNVVASVLLFSVVVVIAVELNAALDAVPVADLEF